jgi:crotonobetainyl-CoA:carnitine CoA-transferase CaiB-like acyl-CoA transferase
MMTKPLDGVTILDASHLAAGPWCTMVLADLGADVIKVERPGTGDIARNAGTVYIESESAIFLAFNRGKRSVALDLSNAEGRAAFDRMVEQADVFVQNYRPGTAERLGIHDARLREINPALVYVSISAFGPSGPYVERPANDPIIQAMSGAMAITGEGDRPPARQGVSIPDFGTGMMAAVGITSALLGRARHGEGCHLEYSLLDVEIFALGPRAQEFLINGEEQPRLGSGHPQFSPYQAFKCKGGEYLYIAVINDKFWKALCTALERPELIDDPRYASNQDRCSNRADLASLLESILAERSRNAWIELFDRFGVPSGPVNTLAEVFDDPQVLHNRVVDSIDHPKLGRVPTLSLPFTISGNKPTLDRSPPMLGQHTREVLEEFGVDSETMDTLVASGVAQQYVPA